MVAMKYFLNYAAYNPNGKIVHRKSNMILQGDSNAAYLVCPEARSRAGRYIYCGNKDRKLFNGPVLVLSKKIKNEVSSASEAEVAALFMNAQEMVPMRQCLEELEHPQPATPLKTDNSTATGIVYAILLVARQSPTGAVQRLLGTRDQTPSCSSP